MDVSEFLRGRAPMRKWGSSMKRLDRQSFLGLHSERMLDRTVGLVGLGGADRIMGNNLRTLASGIRTGRPGHD